jgi:hypothetical protein
LAYEGGRSGGKPAAIVLAEKMYASAPRAYPKASALCGKVAALSTHFGWLSGNRQVDNCAVSEVLDELNFGRQSPFGAELEISWSNTGLHRLAYGRVRRKEIVEHIIAQTQTSVFELCRK